MQCSGWRAEVLASLMSLCDLPEAFQKASQIFTTIHQCLGGSKTNHGHPELQTQAETHRNTLVAHTFSISLSLFY